MMANWKKISKVINNNFERWKRILKGEFLNLRLGLKDLLKIKYRE